MAIMDSKLYFMDAQSLAGSVGATIAGNTVDLGPRVDWNGNAVTNRVGRGVPIYVHARIGTVVAGHVATGTVAVYLQDGGHDTPASYANLVNMNLLGAASQLQSTLSAGKLLFSGMLPVSCKRYLRAKITVAAATLTSGTIDIWMDAENLAKTME